jgi:hypothetical protein
MPDAPSKYPRYEIRPIHCSEKTRKGKSIVLRSVVPRVLPAEEGRAILLGPVHELQTHGVSTITPKQSKETHEEPHASTQCSRSEAVEWSDRVDVDRVGGCARHDYRIRKIQQLVPKA